MAKMKTLEDLYLHELKDIYDAEHQIVEGLQTMHKKANHDDLKQRNRHLNARNALLGMLGHGVAPIVNENDTITTEEIRVGDNDRLAAKIAQMVEAEHFIMLTSVDGLYDRDPSEEGAQLCAPTDVY